MNVLRAFGRLLIALGVFMLLLVHLMLADVPTIGATHLGRRAVELERTRAWRCGYIFEFHSAALVKNRTEPHAAPCRPPRIDDRCAAVLTPDI